MTILDTIFASKHQEVAERQRAIPLAEMRRRAEAAAPARDFAGALLRPGPQSPLRLIAEIKQASPSRGRLTQDFDPLRLASCYHTGGAAAISVLTDEPYFQGSLAILEQVAAISPRPPLLRKDFIFDPYQIYEGRASGADAILLIAAALENGQMMELKTLAGALGMAALVEVHNETELEAALGCQPALLGINNRDLHTFQVSLEPCLRLRPRVPAGIVTVAESGIHARQDVIRLEEAGFDAMLVGESLVTAADTVAALRELLT
jgi:indole-3-glycerol phosphate synthase